MKRSPPAEQGSAEISYSNWPLATGTNSLLSHYFNFLNYPVRGREGGRLMVHGVHILHPEGFKPEVEILDLVPSCLSFPQKGIVLFPFSLPRGMLKSRQVDKPEAPHESKLLLVHICAAFARNPLGLSRNKKLDGCFLAS